MRRKHYRKLHRFRRKKSLLRNKLFWQFLIFLIAVGVFIYLLYFASVFQVKDVKISGIKKISTQIVKDFVDQKLNKKFLLVDSGSIFLADLNDLKKETLTKFPQLYSVVFKRKLPNIIAIELEERTAIGNWCQQESCFSFDKEGVVFEESSPGQKLVVRSEENKPLPGFGEKAIEKDYLKSILEIYKKLNESLKIETKEFVILEKEKLVVQTDGGWKTYFDPTQDLSWQITKLGMVLEKKIPVEKRKNLDYIELRFGNLATFKYR